MSSEIDATFTVPAPSAADYLEILSGPQQGKILRLTKDRLTIGRHPDADLCVESLTVSRYQAIVVRDGDGWGIEDFQSHGGTYLNGVRIAHRMRLQPNDQIHAGVVLIGFRTDRPASGSLSSNAQLELPAPNPSEHTSLTADQ